MTPRAAVVLVLAAFVYGVIYYISLKVHPNRDCPECKGSGKHRGYFFEYAHRLCTRCAGTGRRLRLGTKLFLRQRESVGR